MNLSLYETLAKRWMVGERQGPRGMPPREAWRHPEDLIKIADEWPMPSGWNPNLRTYIKAVLWLHDLIEDGKKEDGTPVTAQDLLDAGAEWAVVQDVIALSQRINEEKPDYLARLNKASWCARLAKCIDRIGNLREGKDCFKDGRWARYVEETKTYIIPLAQRVEWWLADELEKAVAARPVVSPSP